MITILFSKYLPYLPPFFLKSNQVSGPEESKNYVLVLLSLMHNAGVLTAIQFGFLGFKKYFQEKSPAEVQRIPPPNGACQNSCSYYFQAAVPGLVMPMSYSQLRHYDSILLRKIDERLVTEIEKYFKLYNPHSAIMKIMAKKDLAQ